MVPSYCVLSKKPSHTINGFTPTFGTTKPFGHMFESSSTACDLVDEGDKFVVTADIPLEL